MTVCDNDKDRFVNDSPTQLALREWRSHIRHPATLVALAAVAVILTIVAPYGTGDALRPFPRLGYWALVVPATYGAGSLIATMLNRVLPPWPFVVRMGLAGLATGVVVAFVVLGINVVALGFLPERAALPGFILNVAGVALW